MIFAFFAVGISFAFFISSLILLNYGRHLGLRYLRGEGANSMAGLPTIQGAVFALIGLLLAFTVSGALQRFDERRQLVLQEANAVSAAYDRLGLFEGEVAGDLQVKLKDYVRARIELYRMPHDFSLWEGGKFSVSRATGQDPGTQKQDLGGDESGLSGGKLSASLSALSRRLPASSKLRDYV